MKKDNNINLIAVLIVILFIILLCFFIVQCFPMKSKSMQALAIDNSTPEILINSNPVNIDEIIKTNRNISLKEEMIYEEQDLEYTTQYINNDKLPSGTLQVSQIGINGIQDVITIKKYKGDELISEQIVASNVKKASVDKIVEIGTGKRKE